MSIREEQCHKVCRILDDVLANRPTERDALCVAVEKAFETLSHHKVRTGKWIDCNLPIDHYYANCSECGYQMDVHAEHGYFNFCPNCGLPMKGANNADTEI